MSTRTASSDLLKEGTTHLSGVEEAVLKNIEAVKKLTEITSTSFGPNGQNKFVINHLNKLFCTNDAGTIIQELDVEHPAAKLVTMASKMQEEEAGDATNLVVVFVGKLLQKAEKLIKDGLHPPEIISGYQAAFVAAKKMLEDIVTYTIEDIMDSKQLSAAIRSPITAKQNGHEDILAPLVVEACHLVMPKNPKNFNVENVRVAKVVGGGVHDSKVIKGIVVQRPSENDINHMKDAKIAIYTCEIDIAKTETKGTVLIENADQLKDFSVGEEQLMEKHVKALADKGINVVVSGGAFGDMALHFLTRYGIMAVKVLSKFELRRIARLAGATAKVKFVAPEEKEIGTCAAVDIEEVGSDKVLIFAQNECRVSTILVRGSTPNLLEDIHRCVVDAVNNVKQLCRDPRCLPGAGAGEIELALRLTKLGEQTPGLDQYGIKAFGEALEIVPMVLTENAGHFAIEIISNLYAAHASGDISAGVDVDNGKVFDTKAANILDSLAIKANALKLATDTTNTILQIDQIIMARAAGGPKAPQQPGRG